MTQKHFRYCHCPDKIITTIPTPTPTPTPTTTETSIKMKLCFVRPWKAAYKTFKHPPIDIEIAECGEFAYCQAHPDISPSEMFGMKLG